MIFVLICLIIQIMTHRIFDTSFLTHFVSDSSSVSFTITIIPSMRLHFTILTPSSFIFSFQALKFFVPQIYSTPIHCLHRLRRNHYSAFLALIVFYSQFLFCFSSISYCRLSWLPASCVSICDVLTYHIV